MSNKLEKLDLFKLPSLLFVQRTERWASFPNPARQRNALDGSCTQTLLSLHSLLTRAQTDIPTQIQISNI